MASKKSIRIYFLEIAGPIVQRLRTIGFKLRGYTNIHPSVVLERGLNLDRVYPGSIHIAPNCLIASRATILSHEHVYRNPCNSTLPLEAPVYIGARTFIGVGAIVLPGVSIGEDCLIGAGALVVKDVGSGSVVVGVPGKVVRTGIKMDCKARLIQQDVSSE